ncbi:MAG: M48 family metallopeptidase [Saccharofermentanales bacterium]
MIDAEYQIIRTKRKSIAIILRKDGNIEVRAPLRISNRELSAFIEKKNGWIQKAKKRQAESVLLPILTPVEIKSMKAKTYSLVNSFLSDFHDFKPQKIIIRNQRSVWGTCNSKGTISINAKCCLLPESLFEYVMIHELCHLVKLNHSAEFWNLVERYIPDWSKKRAELRKFRIG